MPRDSGARRFTLADATSTLPAIRRATEDAVRESEPALRRMETLSADDPEYAARGASLSAIVERWNDQVRAAGAEAKGLWLVDFDNGDGYYCWRYPEPAIGHFHGYDDGFAGRMKIV
jgi:hypothetical protein